jgi:acyl transferase domain-containing protein/acyl carrier protein
MLKALKEARARLEAAERMITEPIAVVGIGCRFPGGADGPDTFWARLLAGIDAVGPIPRDRYDVDAYYDPAPATPGSIYTRAGAFIDGIDRFDASFFGIAPREASSLDPQQRLLLEVAWEAIEHAGLAPERLRAGRCGVFIGAGRSDYAQRLLRGPVTSLNAWQATGNGLCYGPGRLAHVLDLNGPNMVVDTACSSSLLAVHLACQSLRLRECDLALTGGCHLHLSPQVAIMLSMSRALAADGRCKAFDAAADGFGQGEGCGIVVLRRLSDALERRDTILALIRGSAVNHDGHSSGLTVPNQAAQEQVIRDALANARTQAADIGYVEAHGTGTPLGDPIEIEALVAALCAGRGPDNPLHIGSVKTNIGHLEAAAGVAGLIKLVLSLQRGVIPPHLHLRQPNPRVAWNELPIRIPTQATPWPRGAGAQLAGVSSFGMSGTNVHVVLQAAPEPPQLPASARPLQLVALSAHSAAALGARARQLEAHLRDHTDLALADVAHTANVGRAHFPVRVGLVARSSAELMDQLSELASGRREPGVTADDGSAAPGVVFLFSGQGAQYRNMGQRLYQTQPLFRRTLDACDEILGPQLKASLCRLLFSDDAADRRLDQTRYTQPALFAIEYALALLWQSWGIVPRAVLGHSVGEYAAACMAGVFSLEAGLQLVAERARLMQAVPQGRMAAVFAPERHVRAALVGHEAELALAAVNGSASVVVSGQPQPLQTLLARLEADGIEARELRVSHGFHSPMLDPILAPFTEAARRVDYAAPRIELISNLSGRAHSEVPGADYWAAHARQPVRFAAGLDTLTRRGDRIYVEIGPGSTLLGMAGSHLVERCPVLLPSLLPGGGDWQPLLKALARLYELGVPVDWAGFDRDAPRRRVALPTYPFERLRYWTDDESAPAKPAPAPLPAYRLSWHERRAAAAPPAQPPRAWLIFCSDDDVGERLERLLEQRGERCTRIVAGAAFSHDAGAAWTMAPSDAAGYSRLLAELPQSPHGLGIIWLWDGGEAAAADSAHDTMLAAQWQSCGALLHLVQALAGYAASCARVWLVTRNAAVADPLATQAPALASACLRGFAEVVSLEHPDLWGAMIDVGAHPGDDELAAVAAELTSAGADGHVSIRAGRRYVARVEPLTGTPMPSVPLRADASYLVTGGLGAIGLRVAGWMVERGARHLVLAGRRAPSPQALQAISALRQQGATVVLAAADVAEAADLQRVLDDITAQRPPLRGIVHAAGVYGHEALTELEPGALGSVLRPKVGGAWLLHRLTEHLDLDLFVLFSSVSALWGSKGQAHYAAANAFLDALALWRRRRGLPALSIAWGPWDDDGMVTPAARAWLARVGVRALTPASAMAAFERHLGSAQPHIAIADVDWARFRDTYAAERERPLMEHVWPAPAADAAAPARAASPLAAELASLTPVARHDALVSHLQRRTAEVLGLGDDARLDLHKGFFRLGMDSLMAVELKNRLAQDLGVSLPSTIVFNRANVADLAAYLASEALGWRTAVSERRDPVPAAAASEPAAAADAIAAKLARLESLMREA